MAIKTLSLLMALPIVQASIVQATPVSPSVIAAERQKPPGRIAKAPTDPQTGYPVVKSDRWDKSDTWFQPVLVQNATGTYVAVLDKQKQGSLRPPELSTIERIGLFSNWSSTGIRTYANGQFQVCFFALCGTNYPRHEVNELEVKVGDQVFRPAKEGDRFLVDPALAQALQSATPGKVLVRVYLDKGITVTHPINDETVKSFPKVFQSTASGGDLGGAPVGGGELSIPRAVAVEPFPTFPKKASDKDVAMDPKSGLPLINGSLWRTEKHVAWSRPVVVRDEFDGEYRAVLMRDGGFMTNWSRNFVDVFATSRFATALSFYGVPSLHITVGDRTLNLYGSNYNRFPIDEQAAQFLQEAGEKSATPKATVSYYVGKGSKRSYDVDIGTMKAWASIYR
jgi:hypothetical protein